MNNPDFTLTISLMDEASMTQVVSFSGSLDKAHLPEKKEELQQFIYSFQGKAVIFDFSQLVFINSESIGFLMMLHAHLKKDGRELFFIRLSNQIRDIFNLIGVSRLVPCLDTVPQCISSLQSK